MGCTDAERQRAYKERKYTAGYRQIQLWVKRNSKSGKNDMNIADFIQQLEKLTDGWSEAKKSKLYAAVMQGISEKKEVKNRKN